MRKLKYVAYGFTKGILFMILWVSVVVILMINQVQIQWSFFSGAIFIMFWDLLDDFIGNPYKGDKSEI